MTNSRIYFNAIATYGRVVCALVCGIFTSRWLLKIFGAGDYGLFGVLTGLTVFVSFPSDVLALGVERHFSYHAGEAATGRGDCLDEGRSWFGAALTLHLAFAVALLLVGYPIGCKVLREWLSVPPSRIEESVAFFGFSCINLVFSMMLKPFASMLYARQRMMELSAYATISVVALFAGVWYMASHPGDWFLWYAALGNCVPAVVSVVIAVRAMALFPECRIRLHHMWSGRKFVAILRAAFWQGLGLSTYLARVHGVTILVNKLFGPAWNAAFSVANTVVTHTSSASESIGTAFSPAIVKREGEGRHDEMTQLMFLHCRMSALACAVFVVPLITELPYAIRLWLVKPPEFVSPVCALLLSACFFDCMTAGAHPAVNAVDRLGRYYGFIGVANVLMLVLMYVAVAYFGFSFVSMFAVMVVVRIATRIICVKLANDVVGFGLVTWAKSVMFPVVSAALVSAASAWGVRFLMPEGFLRLCVTSVVSFASFSVFVWAVVLSHDEKSAVRNMLRSLRTRVGGCGR